MAVFPPPTTTTLSQVNFLPGIHFSQEGKAVPYAGEIVPRQFGPLLRPGTGGQKTAAYGFKSSGPKSPPAFFPS